MNIKPYTAALIAMGMVSVASAAAPIEVHITGSTAFRGNFFTAATAASGGIFDAPGGVAQNGATSSSGLVTFTGNIGGVAYALECSWTGSEAGIANVDGVGTLANPGLPNSFNGAGNLPGATTTFPKADGTSGGFTGAGDLTFADTSQSSSLTKPPAHSALHDYGIVGVVTFVWAKGKNSSTSTTDPGDLAWGRLTDISGKQALVLLGSTPNANFLTGNAADNAIPVALVGRNAGSGTRANTLLDTEFGIGTSVSQFALNSAYSANVITYNIVKSTVMADCQPGGSAFIATWPSVATSAANQTTQTPPNLLAIANDGYESGGFVSDNLSCDLVGSELIIVGYAGLGDAKHARDGQAVSGPDGSGNFTPAQPSGAVFLAYNGVTYNDANVVNGTYSFWGHEHLYGPPTPTTTDNTVAAAIKSGIATAGGLGTGSASAQSSGIAYGSMHADKGTFPNGTDTGIPVPF